MGSVAELLAAELVRRGVTRVFGLCGGHIQPVWDALARLGVEVVDVRHECSAVYMAQAQADLGGGAGVVLVTAGPGLTNTVTALANAHLARSPVVLVAGRAPRPQTGMGALQDIPQAALVAPVCRRVETVLDRRHLLARVDAVWSAALGEDGPQGPACLELPTDLLEEPATGLEAGLERPRMTARATLHPDPRSVEAAVRLLGEGRRTLVITGRGARDDPRAVEAFLEATGAGHIDTAESRGVVPWDHPAQLTAVRSTAMAEAELVVTLGRRLDFQLGYGSDAVFEAAPAWLRVGRSADELAGNRRGEVTVQADCGPALWAMLEAGLAGGPADSGWRDRLHHASEERIATARARAPGLRTGEGGIHPLTLLAAVEELVDGDTVVVADGGDILSFARSTLRAESWLDPGALGCLGVGVPFAVSAALTLPGRRVIAVVGDGAAGFSVMELDTAVRRGARVLVVVANNAGWNIERRDQIDRFDGNLVGVELPGCRYDLIARALGARGERVEDAADLPAALRRGLENAPAVVDVRVSREPVSPDSRSGMAGVPTLQALGQWDLAERRREHTPPQGGAIPPG
ncbi:MAG TPA: thiamine pyrophosphate-binding protein [Candidatus Dormibacteraeota bacterium]|nr:thiamine pyrophosphate-binding protein [Candidatus Dormibacteraeota bacterium]